MTWKIPDLSPQYIDRPEYLEMPEYWRMHAFSCCESCQILPSHEDVLDALGIDGPDALWVGGFKEIDLSTGMYAAYRVPVMVAEDAFVAREQHVVPGYWTTQYCVYPPGPVENARIFSGFCGQQWYPCLSWADLHLVADGAARANNAARYHSVAMVLLFPTLWLSERDDPAEVYAELRKAWLALGMLRPEGVDAIAEEMVATMQSYMNGYSPRRDIYGDTGNLFDFLRK